MLSLGKGSVQDKSCSVLFIGLTVTRMTTTQANSCSLLIQLAVFNLVPGRCMGHEAAKARQRSKQEVLDWSRSFPRAETFSSSSQLWLWIQTSKEAKLCLAIQSMSFGFKCLTQFCTWGYHWSQKVWDEFRAKTDSGYMSIKKGFGLRVKQNLPGTKEIQGNAYHSSELDIKVWLRVEKGM